MTTRSTLLAHLSPRLSTGEENLATEALCFVLSQSAPARRGFIALLARILARPLPELTFRTQAADSDGTIPDLVGVDSSGRSVVFVEAKFWAGLTTSQPVGYLRRLQLQGGSGLVVVAPANRLVTLWPELVHLCQEAEMDVTPNEEANHFHLEAIDRRPDASLRHAAPPLGLTSWAAVLRELLHATTIVGDDLASEDLRQIKGLCDNMEESGFLPLRIEELTGSFPRRVEDFCGLVDDLTSSLTAAELASVKGLRATAVRGSYARYLSLKGNGGQVAYHPGWWNRVFATPLWLRLVGPDWKPSASIREALAPRMASQPPGSFVDADGAVLVPLHLPTGRERHLVLASLVDQVRAICALIPAGGGAVALPEATDQAGEAATP